MSIPRIPLILLLALAVTALAGSSAAHAAGGMHLTEAKSAKAFPQRTFVLSLPKRAIVSATDVRVEENGAPVAGLSVVRAGEAGGKSFGVVLAIDASESMHDEAILGAMEAARAFAARRPERQSLGIMFFSRERSIALPLTTDPARIDETLASAPPLTQGTRLNDATSAAIDIIIHQTRLKDGSRRITHITEVVGMEGDVITLQDIFVFDNSAGFDENGRILGRIRSTGLRPKFIEKLAYANVAVDPALFRLDRPA